jgi:hypothetical protein
VAEIAILRSLVEKRLKDLDNHQNPNLDRAMDSIASTCTTIAALVEAQVRIDNA